MFDILYIRRLRRFLLNYLQILFSLLSPIHSDNTADGTRANSNAEADQRVWSIINIVIKYSTYKIESQGIEKSACATAYEAVCAGFACCGYSAEKVAYD
jgi:hypothetical protein